MAHSVDGGSRFAFGGDWTLRTSAVGSGGVGLAIGGHSCREDNGRGLDKRPSEIWIRLKGFQKTVLGFGYVRMADGQLMRTWSKRSQQSNEVFDR